MTTSVAIKINKEGMLQNMRHAFSNSTTVISEALQNARRAKATHIELWYEEEKDRLTIIDDGCGIDDMQKLLTLAESGWDDETTLQENPFGLGWLSAIYSSDVICVESNGKYLDFNTKALLAGSREKVVPARNSQPGTIIELVGFKVPETRQGKSHYVEYNINRMVEGFPVSIFYNGKEMDRPHALNGTLHFEKEPGIGSLCVSGMPGMNTDGHRSQNLKVYLQGLPVYQSERGNLANRNIIHLDSTLFTARLPDRDKLINEGEVIKPVYQAVVNHWRRYFMELKKTDQGYKLIDEWFDTVKYFDLEAMLNDIPALPPACLSYVDENEYPVLDYYDNFNYLLQATIPVYQEEVEQGRTVLVNEEPIQASNIPLYMLMKARGDYIIDRTQLDRNHWAQAYIKDFAAVTPTITAVKAVKSMYCGDWVNAEVIFCDSYQIQYGDLVAIIDDEAMGFDCGTRWDDDNTIYLPVKDQSPGEVVRQLNYFTNNEEVNEDARDREEILFNQFAAIERGKDPANILLAMLNNLSPGRFEKLTGDYTVSINGDKITVKAL